jgi:pimeloyl-ACP methyl ester carboxylesterase
VASGQSDLAVFDLQKYSSLQGYASDVLEICRELALRDVTFVGHSVSAMIGVLAAVRQPTLFENLVLVGPSPAYINQGEYVGGFERQDIEDMLDLLDSNYLDGRATWRPLPTNQLVRRGIANFGPKWRVVKLRIQQKLWKGRRHCIRLWLCSSQPERDKRCARLS